MTPFFSSSVNGISLASQDPGYVVQQSSEAQQNVFKHQPRSLQGTFTHDNFDTTTTTTTTTSGRIGTADSMHENSQLSNRKEREVYKCKLCNHFSKIIY